MTTRRSFIKTSTGVTLAFGSGIRAATPPVPADDLDPTTHEFLSGHSHLYKSDPGEGCKMNYGEVGVCLSADALIGPSGHPDKAYLIAEGISGSGLWCADGWCQMISGGYFRKSFIECDAAGHFSGRCVSYRN